MKRFKFSLENILKYKNQILEGHRTAHSIALLEVKKQQSHIETEEEKYRRINQELNEKNSSGIMPMEMKQYKQYLRILEDNIKKAYARLEELIQIEEEKKEQVVEAKIETSTFDKLKEKKIEEYEKEAFKEEEKWLDEIMSAKMHLERTARR